MSGPKKTNNFDLILSSESTGIEEIAAALTQVSDAFIKINNGPLTRRAIVLLIKDASKVSLSNKEIEAVLDAAVRLKDEFIKKQK